MFCPTSKSHIEAWSRLGNEAWNWTTVSKAVSKAQSTVQLKVPDVEAPDNTWLKIWTDTFQTLGFPLCDVFSGEVRGAAVTPETISPTTGKRFSSVNAYFEPASQRPNLTVVTGASVTRVVLVRDDSGSVVAEGVEYTTPGQHEPIRLKAVKEVVVAAGAMGSPRILELSGIGSASRLEKLGIEVYVDNPNVGENLQNHVMVGTNFEVREDSDMPSRDPLNRQEPDAIQTAMGKAADGQGPLTTSGSNAYAHIPFSAPVRDDFQKRIQSTKGTGEEATATEFAKAHEAFGHSVLTSDTDVPIIYSKKISPTKTKAV